MAGSGAGVTTGGAQDIGAARAQIEAGLVPTSEFITAEGLFSEHDFAVSDNTCGDLLCVKPGIAVYNPILSDSSRVLLHLAMLSNVDAATFRHAPSQLVIVVDRSGSMGGHVGEKTKMDAVKQAVQQLVSALPASDEIALVSFNHEHTVDVPLAPLAAHRRVLAHSAVDRWRSGGSTDIESPLRHAFEILDAADGSESYTRRVLLLTDALPNTGNYEDEDFITLTTQYAAKNIGLTAMGVGLDFGAQLARQISEIRGGNYVFLKNQEDIERTISEDLEFLLSPIAHDFSLSVVPAAGLSLSNVYGLPGGVADEFSMSAATLFLSRNKGALAIELQSRSENIPHALVSITLTYEPATTGVAVSVTLTPVLSDIHTGVDGAMVSSDGVQKMVALVNMATAMSHSLDTWHAGSRVQARADLKVLHEHLERVAESLDDDTLRDEASLVAKLRQNMAAMELTED